MSRNSLRLRLLIMAAMAMTLAVVIAGFGLVALFDRHVERRVDAELETYLRQLAGGVVINADNSIHIDRPLADPRFSEPYSGLYWQIQDDERGLLLRSRSLWDKQLSLPPDPLDAGIVHRHELEGPENTRLTVRERQVVYPSPTGPRRLRVAVGLDRRDLDRARQAFAAEIAPSLALLTVVLLTAVWVQVGIGLKPLDALRRGVQAVSSGARRRLDGAYPDEVMPLVQEVNDLLRAQDETIERARVRAADLAHGLKTPLTVLAADAQRLREKGEVEISAEIDELAGTMQRHVDRELVRARIDVGRRVARVPISVRSVADRVVGTLRRTPKGEALRWSLSVPDNCQAAIDADDLAELVGNLLDNACKWASHQVCLTVDQDTAQTRIIVEDDGPGVPREKIGELGQRGIRLDERVQGSGQGLAIVSDIIAAYGGQLVISNKEPHGLRSQCSCPSAPLRIKKWPDARKPTQWPEIRSSEGLLRRPVQQFRRRPRDGS